MSEGLVTVGLCALCPEPPLTPDEEGADVAMKILKGPPRRRHDTDPNPGGRWLPAGLSGCDRVGRTDLRRLLGNA